MPVCRYCGCKACEEYLVEVEAMKKPVVADRGADDPQPRVEPPKMMKGLTAVTEVVCQPCWEGGEAKGERALFLFLSSSLVKILLKVQSPPLKLMVSGRTWDEAYAALEACLRSPDVPWEQDAPRDDRSPKKKK
jgi:hypothetical protein